MLWLTANYGTMEQMEQHFLVLFWGTFFFVGFFNANLKVCPFLLLTLAMHL